MFKEFLKDTVEALQNFAKEKNTAEHLNNLLKSVILDFEKEILNSGVYIESKIKLESNEKDSQNHSKYHITWESKDIRTHVRLYKKIDTNGFSYQFQRNPTVDELLMIIEYLPLLSEKIKSVYSENTEKLKRQHRDDVENIRHRLPNLPKELQSFTENQLSKYLIN